MSFAAGLYMRHTMVLVLLPTMDTYTLHTRAHYTHTKEIHDLTLTFVPWNQAQNVTDSIRQKTTGYHTTGRLIFAG